jgi:hypothetical protein
MISARTTVGRLGQTAITAASSALGERDSPGAPEFAPLEFWSRRNLLGGMAVTEAGSSPVPPTPLKPCRILELGYLPVLGSAALSFPKTR